ncbi:hypothetical protein MIND_01113100 [Mycena indigotica]|uniref:Uncharacterized protein n=1 Tax=Mycena indigotica TaxID=2126181 RepID=A0A8H6SBJ0_9AGAR|nr:uncharacterized protein MIND_01113100 [Mycena indigotica]KAF7295725.1 hypothetical protein MIND_01113100 [Mycena indigotica]
MSIAQSPPRRTRTTLLCGTARLPAARMGPSRTMMGARVDGAGWSERMSLSTLIWGFLAEIERYLWRSWQSCPLPSTFTNSDLSRSIRNYTFTADAIQTMEPFNRARLVKEAQGLYKRIYSLALPLATAWPKQRNRAEWSYSPFFLVPNMILSLLRHLYSSFPTIERWSRCHSSLPSSNMASNTPTFHEPPSLAVTREEKASRSSLHIPSSPPATANRFHHLIPDVANALLGPHPIKQSLAIFWLSTFPHRILEVFAFPRNTMRSAKHCRRHLFAQKLLMWPTRFSNGWEPLPA